MIDGSSNVPASTQPQTGQAAVAQNSSQQQILLAEDDSDMRALLAWTLSRRGYEVVECGNGYELTARLAEYEESTDGSFALIISDVRMPGVDGIRAIRSVHGPRPLPPVILITAFGTPELHRQAKDMGIAAVLNKPFALSELLHRVSELLARSPPASA